MQGAARATTKGTSIRLRKGLTHYRWCGPGGRYLGGLRAWVTTPTPFVRDSLAPGFAAKGYRVFVYDHYGWGYFDCPYGWQDRTFLSTICLNC